MKGFEIYINDQKLSVAVKKGLISIFIDDTPKISVIGIEQTEFQNVQWGLSDICIGDKLRIVPSEVRISDEPSTVEYIDRQELLSRYYKLKELLINEGLL